MDLFSGVGGVGRAMRRLGYKVVSVDIKHGASHDLSCRRVQRRILRLLRGGRVAAVMPGTPCTSFSLARNRTRVVRTSQFPWGLPDKSDWTDNDINSVKVGNKLARFTLQVLHLCQELSIPWCLENPFSSHLFKLPGIVKLRDAGHVVFHRVCMCAFGARWRKPTGLLFGNVDLSKIHHYCTGNCKNHNGCCQFRRGRRHIILSGSAPAGVPWTRIAQAYPVPFSDALAQVLHT